LKFAQDLADRFKTTNALAKFCELRQRGVGAATTIEQSVDFVHDFTQSS
jgi:hypothetical protein